MTSKTFQFIYANDLKHPENQNYIYDFFLHFFDKLGALDFSVSPNMHETLLDAEKIRKVSNF